MNSSSGGLGSLSDDSRQFRDQLLRSSSKDDALKTAIQAAERSMKAMKLADNPTEKEALSSKFKQILEDAEVIKSSPDWRKVIQEDSKSANNRPTSTVGPNRILKEPQSSRDLPTREKILLMKASFLNGFKFPPWTIAPQPAEFELNPGEALFLDTPELPLSEMQDDCLDDWKRPAEALPPPSWYPNDSTGTGPSMTFSKKIDLVQDAATDCSVVASLCAGVARAERGHTKILRAVLHPYDAEHGAPLMSKNGKYVARLNFNGCYRKVVIDDRLPTSSTSRTIHVVDRQNPGLLWPALVEKAYLKVRGGYDFPGSNSGTDIWILSGWIPEQVFLQSDELEPDRLWKRISNAFSYGDVLVTMGTGKMSCKTERELGLAGEHDYAVLDLKEVDGQRLFLIKNPWCEGPNWRGKSKGSLDNGATQSDEGHSFPNPSDLDDTTEPVQSSRDLLNADDQLSSGTFWMDIDNVIQHFESIYLNWNPGLFAFRQDLHLEWNLTPAESGPSLPRGTSASLSHHPQYTVTPTKAGTIWVLLWRHFQNAVPPDATDDEIEQDRYGIELKGHMSLNAFHSKGRRVLLPDKAVEKGWYVDSPQTLLKLECAPGKQITLVPGEQELPAIKHTFTISAFSDSPITVGEADTRYQHTKSYSGSWTKETAGGNAHSPKYSTNPQFSIKVPQHTNISVLLETMKENLSVHFKLVHSNGKRIHSIRNRDIVFDSKDYRRGCCHAEFVDLHPGQYTIICSTFEPDQYGDFSLLIESDQATQATLLPREGAGRIRLELDHVVFKPGQSKFVAALIPRRLVKLYAVARYVDDCTPSGPTHRPTTRSLIRMSIEQGRGPDPRTLIESNGGEYSDNAGGIRIEDIDLQPNLLRIGEMYIALQRMYTNTEDREEKVSVELFCDHPDAVECGNWQEVYE